MSISPKIVFMGSPGFSVPSLRLLAAQHQITGVVTQPDRPAGRGRALTPPPVKLVCEELGLPIIQPHRLKEPDAINRLISWAPDLIVVAAFGQILRPIILDLPQFGCINVHGSLLPRWRGAAPIQAAIRYGDHQTGITIMRMDPGIDTGPILTQQAEIIQPSDTAESLGNRLANIGAELLLATIPGYLNEEIQQCLQDEEKATYAPMLEKKNGLLDFNLPAEELDRMVRAYNPWPGTFFIFQDLPIKVHKASVIPAEIRSQPGKFMVWEASPVIATLHGFLRLDEVQPAGKKIMSGMAFLQGVRSWES